MQPAIRDAAYGSSGAVATPHYLASLAGLVTLRSGGSAVDAAIAANAVLAVVWPHMCGPGGDLFAQVWSPRDGLIGLNGSGRAGAQMSIEAYHGLGLASIPERGALAVTVPGAIDAWTMLHARWGRLDLAQILGPAISAAKGGFAATPRLCRAIADQADDLRRGGARWFMPAGDPPEPGARIVQPALARTLEEIARRGRAALHGGELGAQVCAAVRAGGGLLSEMDLAGHQGEWVTPLAGEYRGATVCELPPNTQGIAVLEQLAFLDEAPVAAWAKDDVELIDQLVRRKTVAFDDRDAYLGDTEWRGPALATMREPGYVTTRLAQQRRARAPQPSAGGDTVYLCVADRDGVVVSLIQSVYGSFGSGVFVPDGGFVLQNRGAGFSLDPHAANALAPGLRPRHTLIPGLALRGGRPWLAFGTRGADGQAQTAIQLLVGMLDLGRDVAVAVEAPRWVHGLGSSGSNELVLEARFGATVIEALAARGWPVRATAAFDDLLGTAQLIEVLEDRGCYAAAADPRGDSVALAW